MRHTRVSPNFCVSVHSSSAYRNEFFYLCPCGFLEGHEINFLGTAEILPSSFTRDGKSGTCHQGFIAHEILLCLLYGVHRAVNTSSLHSPYILNPRKRLSRLFLEDCRGRRKLTLPPQRGAPYDKS